MTTPAWILWTLTAINISTAVASTYLASRIRGLAREEAWDYLEIIHHVRMTMEDLRSRDPQIAETLDVGLLELARLEDNLRRRAGKRRKP